MRNLRPPNESGRPPASLRPTLRGRSSGRCPAPAPARADQVPSGVTGSPGQPGTRAPDGLDRRNRPRAPPLRLQIPERSARATVPGRLRSPSFRERTALLVERLAGAAPPPAFSPAFRHNRIPDASLAPLDVVRSWKPLNPSTRAVNPPPGPPRSPARRRVRTAGRLDPELAARWLEVQAALQGLIQREQFETWFRRAELRSADDSAVCLAVQNAFTRDWIEKHYQPSLERAVAKVFGRDLAVVFAVDAELVGERRARANGAESATPCPPPTTPSPGPP